jgi:methionyl-tRNA synthetase
MLVPPMAKKQSRKTPPGRQKWVVTSAWPYSNATPHLGNMIGSVLSADVFARYLRQKGDEVVLVSGTDEHGTPIEVSAIEQKIPVEQLAEQNHQKIARLFKAWNISYDNYTRTHNPVHIKFTQDFYLQVQKSGYVYVEENDALYCEHDKLFLPDRFVEGICPYCKMDRGRGDQCDNPACGKLLTPLELISPRCKVCGRTPVVRKTKHWYLNFPKLETRIKEFIEHNKIIPDNARTMCLNNIEKGIPARAITRDLKWGIPAPFEGSEGKTVYVWFEAVLGYLSATKQWAEEILKEPTKWEDFWFDKNTKTVFFIGKDNILFHLIIFPGLLLAYNDSSPANEQWVLPYNVSSTEFLNYEGEKFSKSRGIGIWIDDALELCDVDYWRYYLILNRPEQRDQSFIWAEFQKCIYEVNDVIGNLVHRTITFIVDKFGGAVPPARAYDAEDQKIVDLIKVAPSKIGTLLEKFELKNALAEVVEVARAGNQYLSTRAPWSLIKMDKDAAGHVLNLCAQLARSLAILLSPFIPGSAQKAWDALGLAGKVEAQPWATAGDLVIQAGHAVKKGKPLFEKLNVEDLQNKLKEIRARGSKTAKSEPKQPGTISYEDFQKFHFIVGKVIDAKPVPGAQKLLELKVDLGTEQRTIVGGVAELYSPGDLVGKNLVIFENLEPKTLRGIKSQGMLLAADVPKNKYAIILAPDNVPKGAKIR